MLWYFLLNQNIAAWFAQVSIYSIVRTTNRVVWRVCSVAYFFFFYIYLYMCQTLYNTIYQYSWTRIYMYSFFWGVDYIYCLGSRPIISLRFVPLICLESIFIYKVQRLEKIEFMIFFSSLIKSCKKRTFSLLGGKGEGNCLKEFN